MPEPSQTGLERVAERAIALCLSASLSRSPGESRELTIGLGTGRAAEAFIRALGRAVAEGLVVRGVATSERSERLARELSIPVLSLADAGTLDLAFDGADEVDRACDLTKGLGGAMLRERVIAVEAARFVVLVTPEKKVETLGERCPLPVEVVPFAETSAARRLARIGASATLRRSQDGAPYVTDNGNRVFDIAAPSGGWSDARAIDRAVRAVPGVVDTGFFFALASLVIVGGPDGVEELTPTRG